MPVLDYSTTNIMTDFFGRLAKLNSDLLTLKTGTPTPAEGNVQTNIRRSFDK